MADEESALEKYRAEFAENLMQEYLQDNHKLSAMVAFWLKKQTKDMHDTQMEGCMFSVLTNPDFDMNQIMRDWLTERFENMAKGMDSKEIDDFVEEYF
jgi:flagellar basal body P-ring protein FlgI